VTSREPLGLSRERVVTLGPLGQEDAMALFVAHTEGTLPSGPDVEALVRELDGNPLALHLAARRAHVLSPKEILERIEARLRLLKSDRRDAAPRHRTLEAALEWSWDLLDDDERVAFVALGAFAGSVSLEAFEDVVAPLAKREPLDLAGALLNKSLAVRVLDAGSARLSQSQTLRAFARARLEASDAREAVHQNHADHVLTRAERWAARGYGERGEEALDALAGEFADARLAFDRSLGSRPEAAARIALALSDAVLFRACGDARDPWTELAVLAADRANDARLAAAARVFRAKVLLEIGEGEEAEARLTEATAIAQGAGLSDLVADASRSLAWAHLFLGRPEDAKRAATDAVRHYETSGHVRGHADTLAVSAMIAAVEDDLAEARNLLLAAGEMHAMSGDTTRAAKIGEMAAALGLSIGRDTLDTPEERARLSASADHHASTGRRLREAIDRALLSRLEAAGSRASSATPSTAEARGPAWLVGAGARWLANPSGERVDLVRHGALRLVLDALVDARAGSPGKAISADALLEVGWPGESIRYDSGMLRVYTTIKRLRALGLGKTLITRDDGYLLDAGVVFERSASP
jgi:tetratricopeptide (TPR) repeat protein